MLTGTDVADIRQLFKKLKVWKRHGQRAPHKPLMVLWAIGRCKKGLPRLTHFRRVEDEVRQLIHTLGLPHADMRVEYPFWRLRNDRVWEIIGSANIRETQAGDPFRRDLVRFDVRGGFTEAIYNVLRDDPLLADEIAQSVLRVHLLPMLQERVLEATGVT